MKQQPMPGKFKVLVGLLLIFISSFQSSTAQEFVWAADFPVGASIINISAPDQDGNLREFADLVGEKGLLFMLSRSFDW